MHFDNNGNQEVKHRKWPAFDLLTPTNRQTFDFNLYKSLSIFLYNLSEFQWVILTWMKFQPLIF